MRPTYLTWLVFGAVALAHAPAALAEECPPTKSMSPGTHYQPIDRHQTHIGKGFSIGGVVRSSKDCKPIAHARVAHWQADSKGHYTDDMRAYLYSDRKGHYSFRTDRPGGDDIPRIHFLVTAKGYKTLVTQWVAKGDHRLPSVVFDLTLEPAEAAKAP